MMIGGDFIFHICHFGVYFDKERILEPVQKGLLACFLQIS